MIESCDWQVCELPVATYLRGSWKQAALCGGSHQWTPVNAQPYAESEFDNDRLKFVVDYRRKIISGLSVTLFISSFNLSEQNESEAYMVFPTWFWRFALYAGLWDTALKGIELVHTWNYETQRSWKNIWSLWCCSWSWRHSVLNPITHATEPATWFIGLNPSFRSIDKSNH